MKKVFLFGFLLILAQGSFSQLLPVEMLCSFVQDNGDVQITWEPKYSTLDFARYEIYYSDNQFFNFSKIDEITDIAQNNYVHAGAGAQFTAAYYYIKTIAVSGLSATSDTISTIFPEGVTVNQTYISLKWNASLDPLPSTGSQWYRVYWKQESSPWILLDSTRITAFSHKIFPCHDNYYRIEQYQAGCLTQSSVVKVGRDIEQPETPRLDSVSVMENKVIIGWEQSPAPDVAGYVVHRQNAGIWDTLAVVFGANQTWFLDSLSNPSLQSWKYCVAAFDRCGNTSADMGIPQAQQTLYLESPMFEVCQDRIELNWTPYTNMFNGLDGYWIWAQEGTDLEYVLVGLDKDVTRYVFNQPDDGVTYSFRIQAFNESGITSSSNVQILKVRKPPLPAFSYIRRASVIENRYVELAFYADKNIPVREYRLYRNDLSSGNFKVIALLDTVQIGKSFVDTAVNVGKRPYYYRLVIVDSCGNEARVSNTMSTIFLTHNQGATLEWTTVEGWDAGVLSYHVFRISDGDTSFVADVGTNTTWTDEQADFQKKLFYFVKAFEADGNIYGFKEVAVSNIVKLEPRFSIAIPNAFAPWRSTTNTVFRPRMISYDPGDYYFAIFNRFGQMIFESHDPSEGWDGTYRGRKASSGLYVYYLRVLSSQGRYEERRGMVVLLD